MGYQMRVEGWFHSIDARFCQVVLRYWLLEVHKHCVEGADVGVEIFEGLLGDLHLLEGHDLLLHVEKFE